MILKMSDIPTSFSWGIGSSIGVISCLFVLFIAYLILFKEEKGGRLVLRGKRFAFASIGFTTVGIGLIAYGAISFEKDISKDIETGYQLLKNLDVDFKERDDAIELRNALIEFAYFKTVNDTDIQDVDRDRVASFLNRNILDHYNQSSGKWEVEIDEVLSISRLIKNCDPGGYGDYYANQIMYFPISKAAIRYLLNKNVAPYSHDMSDDCVQMLQETHENLRPD